jgi:hypothetical protein
MNVLPLDLTFFTERLSRNEPVSVARYGDGEMLAVLGTKGSNCDGSQYFPDLSEALRQTLEVPRDYLHCIAPKVTSRKNGLTESSFHWITKHCPQVEWYDSEVFLNAMLAGTLAPLIEVIEAKEILVVGNTHLRKAPLHYQEFVEIPTLNAWLDYAFILDQVRARMHAANVVLFCGGMTSKVLIYDLYPTWGKTHFMLDFGSILDQAVGVLSRSYSRRLKQEERDALLHLNFPVDSKM